MQLVSIALRVLTPATRADTIKAMAMTDRSQELEIKIAKAKDLPLSWFDLVLRPEKFKQHIKTLEDNPNSEHISMLHV